jgi:ankyrin repeat protein
MSDKTVVDDVDAGFLIFVARHYHSTRGDCLYTLRHWVEKHHANVNATDSSGMTALMYVASRGYLDACQWLVEAGHADVNTADRAGMTALMYASYHGHLKVCEFLVEAGHVNVGAVDSRGMTALMYACKPDYMSVSWCLVDTGRANVEAKSHRDGRTALHMACYRGSFRIARCLIALGGANVDTTDDKGRNALHFACQMDDTFNFELVQYLVQRRPTNIDAAERECGFTALHWACFYGKLDAVRCLIEDGFANVKAVATTGETVLHLACRYGHSTPDGINFILIRYLVETCRVDTFVRDQMDRTALHEAASQRRSHLRLVLYLTSRFPIHDHM